MSHPSAAVPLGEPAAASPLVPLGRALFKVRGWLFVPFALFALLWTRWEWEADEILWPLGLSLALCGAALRFSAIRRMGGAARTHKDKAKRLVATGPYAWVRNPLYLANLTAFAGFVVLCELPWFAGVALVLLGFAYHAIARYEETILEAAFEGEFRAYRARVSLWFPHPPESAIVEDPATLVPLRKVLRKERGSILNLLLMVGLAALKEYLVN